MNLGLETLQSSVFVDEEEFASYESCITEIASIQSKLNSVESVLSLLNHVGKTKAVDNYLCDTFAGFEHIELSSMSQESLVDLMTQLKDNLEMQLDIAYEGWFNNVLQKIKHTFTPDSKCAKIIREGLIKFQNVDADVFESKEISYKLIPFDAAKKSIKGLSGMFNMLSKYAEDLLQSYKIFGMRHAAKQALLDEINRLRKKMDDTVGPGLAKAQLSSTKNMKGQTYKAAGYTKAATLGVLKEYASACAGLLKQLKALETLLWTVGSEISGVSQVGNTIVVVQKIKSTYQKLYSYCVQARDAYVRLDYCMYRIVKDI